MDKVFIIAEIGQAHDGSLGILHSYIDALSKTGIDAIKFQTHIAEAESSRLERFRVKFSYEDKLRFDYWKRMEFSLEQWQGIKNHCEEVGLEFISSPFSIAAVNLLEELKVKKYKIGSGEVTNFLMLEKIAKTGKSVILSSGMSSFDELQKAVMFIKPYGNQITILQCTTSYPTPYSRLGLNILSELRLRFPDCSIGLSEHTGEIYAGIAAVALGAKMLEFHAVFDKRMFGPDSTSSLSINQINELVRGVRAIEDTLKNPINKDDLRPFKELKGIFEKSLAINKNLKEKHIISFDDLEAKKPAGQGIPASRYKKILGKRLNKDLTKWSFLNYGDFYEE